MLNIFLSTTTFLENTLILVALYKENQTEGERHV